MDRRKDFGFRQSGHRARLTRVGNDRGGVLRSKEDRRANEDARRCFITETNTAPDGERSKPERMLITEERRPGRQDSVRDHAPTSSSSAAGGGRLN